MGLDMYMFKAENANEVGSDTCEEVGYWRKHPDLHSYIEELWREAGCPNADEAGDNPLYEFNCIEFPLTREQLEEIRELSEEHKLPTSPGGFFFSKSAPEDDPRTVEIMDKALEMLDEDPEAVIFYYSWW